MKKHTIDAISRKEKTIDEMKKKGQTRKCQKPTNPDSFYFWKEKITRLLKK